MCYNTLMRSTCSWDGCNGVVVGRMLCMKHYMRTRCNGTAPGPKCKIEDCLSCVSALGYCNSHYRRHKLGKPMNVPLRLVRPGALCSVAGCSGPHLARGFCCTHYSRWSHGNNMMAPIKPYHRGGRRPGSRVDKAGYVGIYEPTHPNANATGYVLEHRKVMADHLGRALLRHESVHHKNGNRSDNRISNLELWSSSQPYGQRVADKVQWAREILALYASHEDLVNAAYRADSAPVSWRYEYPIV